MQDLKDKNLDILLKKISGILFSYNEPVSFSQIKNILEEESLDQEVFHQVLSRLDERLTEIGLSITEDTQKEPTYIVSIQNELSPIIRRIREDELEGDLSPAALQVLTICAYLGASSKNEISFIRGVQSSQSIRSLMSRGLLKKMGERFVLSIDALQKLGINKIADLPEYESISNDFRQRLEEILEEDKENN